MDNVPELYEVFKGEVANVTDYGAFIKIPGCTKQGLVHRTHMSSSHVDRPSEVVDVGERVWVKVIGNEVKDGKHKISLSMKVVHQGTGKDIDPNNVVLEQDARKRREFKDYSKQKITLEAVLNTVCKKCGCKGHFAQDCFSQPGGSKYSLLPEEEEEEDQTNSEKTTKKKKKQLSGIEDLNQEKKRKKHSRDKEASTDSESSSASSSDRDSEPAKKKKRHAEKSKKSSKKKKKHKKHKQRH